MGGVVGRVGLIVGGRFDGGENSCASGFSSREDVKNSRAAGFSVDVGLMSSWAVGVGLDGEGDVKRSLNGVAW